MATHPSASWSAEVESLATELINRRSITPDDAGCQQLIGERLAAAGFRVEHQRFGDVDNLWACHGDQGPRLVFLGHTDVVPPGDEDRWHHPPFAAVTEYGELHGRGAADMKGSVAAMTIALEHFLADHPDHAGSVGLLVTSDEEGPATDGTRRMVQWLRERDEAITYCVVGEPSCTDRLGDTLRVGRRGTLSGDLVVHGIQGHVAYPERADNPVHGLARALARLVGQEWDGGDADFPPTSLQISNLDAGTGADNVIPARAQAVFNFRYGAGQSADGLQSRVRALLDAEDLDYTLTWRHGGEPFRTPPGTLRSTLRDIIREQTGIEPRESTAGGTSDGRFVAPTGAEVIEFGPRNETIHQIDERISLADLATLASIYHAVAHRLLAP